MKNFGIILMAFIFGYAVHDFSSVIPNANAEVAGMDSSDLKSDYDFKRAVESIVESNCTVAHGLISC